ncbi:amidase [Streptomyces sp. NPDC050617]|uniref:amidase n=1 Tax=Streptomyces sp. NPDC050617 TaxID=3154628 RepID=UPI0034434C8D
MRNPMPDTDRLCDRIERLDAHVRAFVAEPGRRERLRAEAAETAARHPDGSAEPPLYGVAVGVKDIVRVDGLPTRAGSEVPAEVLYGPQAAVVDRLRAAGALVAGKTVTAEFAVTAPGPTRNPRNLEHTPGGSSSGSAAAVAAGMVELAIGTQTVGSVIRPAAFCGVVGYKPTHGRIPTAGVIDNAPTLDAVGVFAPDVAGAARAAAVLCDGWRAAGAYDRGPADRRPVGRGAVARGSAGRRPVLGVPDGPYLRRAGDEALTAFAQQVERLVSAGFPVLRVPFMEDYEEIVRQQFLVNRYEVARAHADWFSRHERYYREETVAAIRQGHGIARADYEGALRFRGEFRARLSRTMEEAGIDLWIMPAAPGPAPRGIATTGNAIMNLPWSYAGAPALTVPADRTADGLPLGLQTAAAPGADEYLIASGAGIEAAVVG